jgi:hypothetical protein
MENCNGLSISISRYVAQPPPHAPTHNNTQQHALTHKNTQQSTKHHHDATAVFLEFEGSVDSSRNGPTCADGVINKQTQSSRRVIYMAFRCD